MSSNLITMQNLAAVCHIVCGSMSEAPKICGAGAPLTIAPDHIETYRSLHVITPNFVSL